MIRVRRPTDSEPMGRLVGVIERLATGDKTSFESEEELIRLLRNWTDRQPVEAALPDA